MADNLHLLYSYVRSDVLVFVYGAEEFDIASLMREHL